MAGKEYRTIDLWSVILTAGAGSRMPTNKPLTPIGGRPMIEYALRLGRASSDRNCIVVSGAHIESTWQIVAEFGCAMVHNPQWSRGMGASIAQGVAALPSSATHVLILLLDQPLVRVDDLSTMVAASRDQPESIIASAFGDTAGPPAIFPRRTFTALTQLTGDQGAKTLVQQDARVTRVSVPAAQWDIDDARALAQVRSKL